MSKRLTSRCCPPPHHIGRRYVQTTPIRRCNQTFGVPFPDHCEPTPCHNQVVVHHHPHPTTTTTQQPPPNENVPCVYSKSTPGAFQVNIPENANVLSITAVGAGGGGSGGKVDNYNISGGGGGAGATLMSYITALQQPDMRITGTVGAGGQGGSSGQAGNDGGITTFRVGTPQHAILDMSLPGGRGGSIPTPEKIQTESIDRLMTGTGGEGGQSPLGTIILNGQSGQDGQIMPGSLQAVPGGDGAGSLMAAGGNGGNTATTAGGSGGSLSGFNGKDGGPGSGGGGGASALGTGNGGNGGNGFIFIQFYHDISSNS